MEPEALNKRNYISDDSYDSDIDIQEVLNRDKEIKLKKRQSDFVILISDSEDEEDDSGSETTKAIKVPGILQTKNSLDSYLKPTEYLISEFKRLTNLDSLIDIHLHKRGVTRPPNAEVAYIKPLLTDPRYKLLYPATSLKYEPGAETRLNLLATHPLINSEEKYEKYEQFLAKHHLKECSIDMTKDNPVLDSVNAFKRYTNEHKLAKFRKHIDHKILSDYWKRHISQKTYMLGDLDLEMFLKLTNFGQVVDNYLKEYGDIIRDVFDVKIDYYFDILKKDPRNRNMHIWFRGVFPHPWVKIIWEPITPHQEKFLCKSPWNFKNGSNIVELLSEEHPDASEKKLKEMLKFQFYKYRTFPKNRKQGIFKYLEINHAVYKAGWTSDSSMRKKHENIQARPKLTRRRVKNLDPVEEMKTETLPETVQNDNKIKSVSDHAKGLKSTMIPDTVQEDNRINSDPDTGEKENFEIVPDTAQNDHKTSQTQSAGAKVTNSMMETESIETREPEVVTSKVPEEICETTPVVDLTKTPKIVKLSPHSPSISKFRKRSSRKRVTKRNQSIRILENISEPYVNTESDNDQKLNKKEEENPENSRDDSTNTANYPSVPGPSYSLLENQLFNIFNEVLPDTNTNAQQPISLHLDECHDLYCIDCNNFTTETSTYYQNAIPPNGNAMNKNEFTTVQVQQKIETVPVQFEMINYAPNNPQMDQNIAYIITDSGDLQLIDIGTVSNFVSISNNPQPISLFEINQHNTYTLVNQPTTSSAQTGIQNVDLVTTNLEPMNYTQYVQVIQNALAIPNNPPLTTDEWNAQCANIVNKLKHNTNISSLVYHLKKMEFGDENILSNWVQNGFEYIQSYVMNEIIMKRKFDGIEFKGKYRMEDLLQDIMQLFPHSTNNSNYFYNNL